jgi:predicted DNA-binding transcriptional regulator YafY
VEVVLHGSAEAVAERVPPTVGTLTPHPDGTQLRARAEDPMGMARMLAGLGFRFTVLRPDEVREAVGALAAELAQAARR